MRTIRRMRNGLGPLLACVLVGALIVPAAAAAKPLHLAAPGAARPDAVSAVTGDCELSGVICRPSEATSCSTYTSQTTPPNTIRVAVRTSSTALTIKPVPFETYVEDVLPNEWVPSYDGDSLKAGAVAVKSYAWYWVTHYGGYLGTASSSTCFDVTDDQDFQVYKAGSAQTRTTSAVTKTWPFAARVDGKILEARYISHFTSTSEPCGSGANGTIMSQDGSENCIDPDRGGNLGNKYNVILAKYYYPGLQLATTRQIRTPDDFTFSQTSTHVVFAPATGVWSIDDGYGTTFTYGRSGDIPAVTNFGDGFAALGVFRPSNGTWYQANPTGGNARTTVYGRSGDIPVAGHYNGIAAPSVLAVFRPSNGTWYQANSAGGNARTTVYGRSGDIPVPGDYNGDGTTDIAVYRPSTGYWYLDGAAAEVKFGQKGDIPVPGDYNGDGTTEVAVYRPSNHTWYVRGSAGVVWGVNGDIPVTGDYNGDGTTDLAVYRPSNRTWYARGQAARAFGYSTSIPIGKAPAVK